MARRGRPPVPTKLKILRGNPGCRPLNLNEPQPAAGRPELPPELSDSERECWDRVTDILDGMHVLTKADGHAIRLYCTSFATWMDARKQVQAEGLVVDGKPNPYLAIMERAHARMHSLMADFGLTPAARTRLHVMSEKKGASDGKAKFFRA